MMHRPAKSVRATTLRPRAQPAALLKATGGNARRGGSSGQPVIVRNVRRITTPARNRPGDELEQIRRSVIRVARPNHIGIRKGSYGAQPPYALASCLSEARRGNVVACAAMLRGNPA